MGLANVDERGEFLGRRLRGMHKVPENVVRSVLAEAAEAGADKHGVFIPQPAARSVHHIIPCHRNTPNHTVIMMLKRQADC